MSQHTQTRPEIWGGVECTVNRLGDRYRDQLVLTGHHDRIDDLDRIAELGIRAVRYPVLWERTETRPGEFDWTWADARLTRLLELGIEPIVGLVHHGSGPKWTSLVDDSFATGVAEFARVFAERYPWVRRYTIINEPLTTARFSALYGHWYPHMRSDRAFLRALLNQCDATRRAMKVIRAVNSAAELVQTEDVSQTHGSPATALQAAFYDHRGWLSLDLLHGRVTASHPLREYLEPRGVTHAELDGWIEDPCPPDIIGLNYYVASDRYLDADVDRYPPERRHFAGGAWFVDVEAVRTEAGLRGHRGHIDAAWERYRRPIAITEVHLGCTCEEQLRWLMEAWHAATDARAAGTPVVAICPWALFGSVDWDSLVTRSAGYHELGAFDTRGGIVRPRALATVIRDLATTGETEHAAAAGAGWWRRDAPAIHTTASGRPVRPVLIAGAGTLARELSAECRRRGIEHTMLSRSQMDIADRQSVADTLDRVKPWLVLNACGFVNVDQAQSEVERCWRDNVFGPAVLAEEADLRGINLVTFSSDLVFDGKNANPYVEEDPVSPLSVYGDAKVSAERAVLSRLPHALVIRTAAFFGPEDSANFLVNVLKAIADRRPFAAATDLVVSPTYVPDLAAATIELAIDGATGIWHLTNGRPITWWEFATAGAERFGLEPALVERKRASDLDFRAPRPAFSALDSRRGRLMPSLESALDRFVRDVDKARIGLAVTETA
jgi:dTDP-4-dehydrorhamnose reductase